MKGEESSSKNVKTHMTSLMEDPEKGEETYPVFRTDGVVRHLLKSGCVQESLDFGESLNVLCLGHLTVNGLEDLAGTIDAPFDDVVLLRVRLPVALLQQLLQQERVLNQTLMLNR